MNLFTAILKFLKGSAPASHVEDGETAPPRWQPPTRPLHRKGKRKTDEERKTERESFAAHMLKAGAARAVEDARRAKSIGATQYIWRSSGDADVCKICAANEGKRFSFNRRPAHGHPGEGTCVGNGYCRCYSEIVLPKR